MRAIGQDQLAGVLAALRRGRLVLCIGGELASDGSLRRLIGKLLQPVAEAREIHALVEGRPLMAADYVRRRLGDRFGDELRRATDSTGVPEPLALFGALPFSSVLTTSYDAAVVRAFIRSGELPRVLTPADAAQLEKAGRARFVFRLLGDPNRPETVVFGAADLQAALASGGYAAISGELFKTHSFLLVGFDWSDAELSVLLERILSGAPRGMEHFAVLPRVSPLERDELQAIYGLTILDEEDPIRLARALGSRPLGGADGRAR